MPADADPNTVAVMFAQQYPMLANYETWLSLAAKLCPPVLAGGASSGYSAPSYTSFGGTVTPSGNGATFNSRSGTNFVLLCTLGGAVGVAKFKVSTDGGNSFGAEQTTSASMTDATSGITLAFAGTLTLNGTAQFHSACTPQLVLPDTAGSVRSAWDHNGLRSARVIEGYEGYIGQRAAITVDATFLAGSPFRIGLSGASTQADFGASFEASNGRWTGRHCRLLTSTTNGNRISVEMGAESLSVPLSGDNAILVFYASIALTNVGASNQTALWGIIDDLTAAPRNTAANIYGFKRLSGGNWLALRRNVSVDSTVDTGIAPVANVANRLRVEIHGLLTPLGAAFGSGNGLILYFIDDKLVASNTNQSSTGYALCAELVNTGGLGGAQNMYVSPQHWVQVLHGNAPL
jgi:hypothetical protein